MKKKEKPSAATSFAPGATSAPRLTAEDIQSKEFRIARFRGYKERDVDEFLDELTRAWGAIVEENRRLSAQSASWSAIGAPDLDDVGRQADEIIARAREEAARIVREAEERAGVTGAGDADRTAVSAFLSKERQFLQELASVVQGHAEGVKGMAREVFRPSPGATGLEVPDAPSPATEVAEVPAEAPMAEAPSEEAPTIAEAPEEGPIRIEEPEPAGVRAREGEDDGPEPGDRSLKDLFWGEE